MIYAQYAANLTTQPIRFSAIKPVQEPCLAQDSLDVVLVVGDLKRWRSTDPKLRDLHGSVFKSFGEVTADLLNTLCPTLVVSDLMADNFDGLDLARKLSSLGFEGQYRALTYGLPNRLMVLTEVRMVAPKLDFNILEVTDKILQEQSWFPKRATTEYCTVVHRAHRKQVQGINPRLV